MSKIISYYCDRCGNEIDNKLYLVKVIGEGEVEKCYLCKECSIWLKKELNIKDKEK